ncbi:MAG: hypothetical protein M0P12_04540 [Paludibacteraceae bacterium]|nr:hypothetical protein [Paludibacteraceae bacterium]MCK9615797.1 hypothetical protein [Candidatus Omnitrophota bacterium]
MNVTVDIFEFNKLLESRLTGLFSARKKYFFKQYRLEYRKLVKDFLKTSWFSKWLNSVDHSHLGLWLRTNARIKTYNTQTYKDFSKSIDNVFDAWEAILVSTKHVTKCNYNSTKVELPVVSIKIGNVVLEL